LELRCVWTAKGLGFSKPCRSAGPNDHYPAPRTGASRCRICAMRAGSR
jgi:hypothetical protein